MTKAQFDAIAKDAERIRLLLAASSPPELYDFLSASVDQYLAIRSTQVEVKA